MDYISKSCCPVTSSSKLLLTDSTPSCEQKTTQGVARRAEITLCQLPQSPHAAAYELNRWRKWQVDSFESTMRHQSFCLDINCLWPWAHPTPSAFRADLFLEKKVVETHHYLFFEPSPSAIKQNHNRYECHHVGTQKYLLCKLKVTVKYL